MRNIQVSTPVFAAIWSKRQEGENDENAILERLLDIKAKMAQPASASDERIGYLDARYNALFKEGTEIFRNYLGTDYRAKATGGLDSAQYRRTLCKPERTQHCHRRERERMAKLELRKSAR
jgi:hypothetical protein